MKSRQLSRAFGILWSVIYWAVAAGVPSAHAEAGHSEASVEAAYLFRFYNYIEWPTPPAADHAFVIDVVGDPEVARELRHLIPANPLKARVVQVREIASVRDLAEAQIVYVGAGNSEFLRTLAAKSDPGILIVSHEEDGLDLGAMLNFVTVDNRVRFEVSLASADRGHLKVSADLLSVALRVHGAGRQTGGLCITPFFLRTIDACAVRAAADRWQYPRVIDGGSFSPVSADVAAVDAGL